MPRALPCSSSLSSLTIIFLIPHPLTIIFLISPSFGQHLSAKETEGRRIDDPCNMGIVPRDDRGMRVVLCPCYKDPIYGSLWDLRSLHGLTSIPSFDQMIKIMGVGHCPTWWDNSE